MRGCVPCVCVMGRDGTDITVDACAAGYEGAMVHVATPEHTDEDICTTCAHITNL